MLGIENTHLAFCFDETVEYILSYRNYRKVTKNGKSYNEMYWTKIPKWNDEEEETKKSFFDTMRKNLETQKKLRGIQ